MPRESWWAESSTSTTPAEPASPRLGIRAHRRGERGQGREIGKPLEEIRGKVDVLGRAWPALIPLASIQTCIEYGTLHPFFIANHIDSTVYSPRSQHARSSRRQTRLPPGQRARAHRPDRLRALFPARYPRSRGRHHQRALGRGEDDLVS